MGIQIEFNPDLALRDYSEYEKGNREKEECLPESLEVGVEYEFLKEGQRVYWLSEHPDWSYGQIPLFRTEGKQRLSRPLASIKIIEYTHFLMGYTPFTRGKYRVEAVFDPSDERVHFEGLKRI